jgi:spermidine synthase
MNRWELIESATVPGSQSVMALMRRGDELVIRVDGKELMGNRVHGSEDALADLAWDRLDERSGPQSDVRILIGGLGIGFTLAAALKRLGPKGKVVVAELVPQVVSWNRGPLGEAAGHPVLDPRTAVYSGDVSDLIADPPAPWDAVLLDVDNGPDSLTRESNDWLYSPEGLDACFAALTPGGVLGVWSASPDNSFTRRFARAGFDVEPIQVRARGAKGGRRHTVWIGVRKKEAPRWKQGRSSGRAY